MKLSKSLSQVFLKDANYINLIINSLDVAGEEVLEIGSGTGEISRRISAKAKFLYCIELDQRFIPVLEQKFKQQPNVKVIHGNILEFSLSDLGKQLIIFGNVPYQISYELIEYLVKYRQYIKRVYLTLQKEFVQKLIAQVSTKPYSFLTCYIQYYAKVTKIFDIPAKAFMPIPKVDSSFIRLEFYRHPPYEVKDEAFLFKIIHQAFSQRRKKIINSLPLPVDKHLFFNSLNINPNSRPENLSLQEYIAVANRITGNTNTTQF